MTLGMFLGAALFILFLCWLAIDIFAWLLGQETFTKWVIKKAMSDKIFALATFLAIAIAAIYLIVHFELPEILFNINL